MGELRARFDLSRKVKSRSSDTALVASGSRREKSERVGAKHKVMGKNQSCSSRGYNSAGSATTSEKEGRKVSCSIFKETGHTWFKCSQRICSICRETGHDPNKCPKMKKEDANLAISDQVGLVADADAFVSISQGEREFCFGCSGGTERLDCEIGEIETWIFKRNIRTCLDLVSIPQSGGKHVKTFSRCDHSLQIQNLFMAFKRTPLW